MEKLLHLESNRYSVRSINKLKKIYDVVFLQTNSQIELTEFLNNNNFSCIFTKIGLEINVDIIKSQSNLKYIVTPTTGLNHIDVDFARNCSINIISLKDDTEFLRTIKSTAEHTWGLIISILRNISSAFDDVKLGNWRREPFIAEELNGKTIGIIGFGRLGKIVAEYAKVFSMNVIVYDIDSKAYDNSSKNIKISSSVDQLIMESDIISIHIPSNKNNYKYFDSNKINMMKNEAYLINTSRGELIDEIALLSSLKNKKIKGAALDVLDGDSSWGIKSNSDNKLIDYSIKNKNLLITPHMGGYGKQSIFRTRDFITEKFLNRI
jgi:D-3-phosphoglycerate dehydrogenase